MVRRMGQAFMSVHRVSDVSSQTDSESLGPDASCAGQHYHGKVMDSVHASLRCKASTAWVRNEA